MFVFLILCFCCECSAAASSMSALMQPTIRVVAIIAEGVPESDTKQLIAFARANNKVRNTNKFCKHCHSIRLKLNFQCLD